MTVVQVQSRAEAGFFFLLINIALWSIQPHKNVYHTIGWEGKTARKGNWSPYLIMFWPRICEGTKNLTQQQYLPWHYLYRF